MGFPPWEGSKKLVPTVTSNNNITAPAVTAGRPNNSMICALKTAQTKIGNRKKVIPGARIFTTVVTKLTAPIIEDTPEIATAKSQRSCPVISWPVGFCTLTGG